MPIHDYICKNCGNVFEKLNGGTLIECPECKEKTAHKSPIARFSSPSISNKKDKNIKEEEIRKNKSPTNGHVINMGPYSGMHFGENCKNAEISNLTFKKDDTSSISSHPEANLKIKNCKIIPND
jgi:putative FmdB family regulatory protein